MIVFQFEESLQRGMSSLMLLALCMLQKRTPWTTLFTGKRKQAFGLLRSCPTCTGTWEMRGRDSICVLDFFFFLGEKWLTRLGHGLCYPKKKKTVTHFLSHQSPPTSSHTDLLCRQSSSHSNLFFFFFFSSIYFSFVVSPFALILVLFLFTLFFIFYFFPASHYHTCRALFYFQPPTWTKDV